MASIGIFSARSPFPPSRLTVGWDLAAHSCEASKARRRTLNQQGADRVGGARVRAEVKSRLGAAGESRIRE